MPARSVHTAHGAIRISSPTSARDLPVERGRSARDYEFQVVTIPRGVPVSAARASLTDEAEYGRWELARTRLYFGGGQKVWMRRRIQRVRSTLDA